MTDFKKVKHFNCSLDFNLTHLLAVGVMLSFNALFEMICFFIDCLTISMLKVPLNTLMLLENIEFRPP